MYKKSNFVFSDENMNKKTLKIAEIFSTALEPDLFKFL